MDHRQAKREACFRRDPKRPVPRNVEVSMMRIHFGGRRGCELIESARCTACGWWGSLPAPGEALDLFQQSEHTDEECRRRQLDPEFRRAQDQARLALAGLPTLPEPEQEQR